MTLEAHLESLNFYQNFPYFNAMMNTAHLRYENDSPVIAVEGVSGTILLTTLSKRITRACESLFQNATEVQSDYKLAGMQLMEQLLFLHGQAQEQLYTRSLRAVFQETFPLER